MFRKRGSVPFDSVFNGVVCESGRRENFNSKSKRNVYGDSADPGKASHSIKVFDTVAPRRNTDIIDDYFWHINLSSHSNKAQVEISGTRNANTIVKRVYAVIGFPYNCVYSFLIFSIRPLMLK